MNLFTCKYCQNSLIIMTIRDNIDICVSGVHSPLPSFYISGENKVNSTVTKRWYSQNSQCGRMQLSKCNNTVVYVHCYNKP